MPAISKRQRNILFSIVFYGSSAAEITFDHNEFRNYVLILAGTLYVLASTFLKSKNPTIPSTHWLLNFFTFLIVIVVFLFPPWEASVLRVGGSKLYYNLDRIGYRFIFAPPDMTQDLRDRQKFDPESISAHAAPRTGWVGIALLSLIPPYWFARMLIQIAKELRERRYQKPGQCRSCGYDLRATAGRCPECGATQPHTRTI